MLREVISDEAGKEGRVVAFNQLKHLELDGLTGLRCFSSGGYTLMFPLLKDVIVSGCPNMKIFSEGPIEASKVERVKVSEKEWFWTENLNITIQYMFGEMGTIIGVKSMWLSEFPHLIGKWHRELGPVKSSWQLQSLMVDRCPSFVNAISSNLLLALDNLWVLQVCDCESLKEIFDMEGLEAMESTLVLPWLKELTLVNLPKLRRLWNKNLQESLRLKYLSRLILYNYSILRHAFTSSMVRCLPNLWWIEIKECGEMEGVIADEEGPGSAVEKIAFPNLRRIELKCLPNLTSFLLGKNHTLECPELEELTIAHCPKIRSLTRGSWMEIDEGTPSLFTPQGELEEHEKMVSVLKQVDIVISTVPISAVPHQVKIIDAIIAAGNIKRFLPSEFGCEEDRITALPPFEAFLDKKKKIRRLIEASAIPYTFVSANCFAEYFINFLLHPHDPRPDLVVYGTGEAKAVLNSEKDIAEYTIKVVNDLRMHNRIVIYRPPGNIISQNELISLWEKKMGRSFNKVYVPEDEMIKRSQNLPSPDNIAVSIIYSIFMKGDLMSFDLSNGDVEASRLYPEIEYTTIDQLLDLFLVDPPEPACAVLE